jgi:integrase
MLNLVENLQFKADFKFVTKDSPCFKSVNYPPKDDFVMSINQSGEVLSRYGDDTWDFTPFNLSQKLRFKEFDDANKALFKQLMYYVIYSHLFPGKYSSLTSWYKSYQIIFRQCTKHKIIATELSRFPKVIEEMGISYAKSSPSNYIKSVWHYDVIHKNREQIGFTILNEKGISIYKNFDPDYDCGQTPYIPNRIWTKFIQYHDLVLDDFESDQDKLKNLYNYLVSTMKANENIGVESRYCSPFIKSRRKGKEYYNGTFDDYLSSNGLLELFEKYIERPQSKNIKSFSIDNFGAYLNNIAVSCYLYILFYSIMRKSEALSIRTDCLKIESDMQAGNFYLLVGETTKTDPDSDARWIVPKRVERAVNIAKELINWKSQYIPTTDEVPYLLQNLSVWQVSNLKQNVRIIKSFDNVIDKAPHFFKPKQFEITKEDYDEALALTPSLIKSDWFKVGGFWNFSYHQFRRTLAVHFALNKVSVSSIQLQMKHGTREQQFHYQNNAGRLRLNRLAEELVINEYYAEMGRNISSIVYGEKTLPHKQSPIKKDIVSFVEAGEMEKLLKAQKNGAVGYRKNILGGCMKQGSCEYGGFDTIAHCAGGVSGHMCTDLIIDGSREKEFQEDKIFYETQRDKVSKDSPRYMALEAEIRGYEKVLDVIKNKAVKDD